MEPWQRSGALQILIDQALELARTLPRAEAETVYRELLQVSPGNPAILQALAALHEPAPQESAPPPEALDEIVSLYAAGRFPEALAQTNALLTGYPHSEVLHNIAGALYAALAQFHEAIAHYDQALALAPDYFEALNNRGIALMASRRLPEAVDSFDRAIGFNPDYAEAHMNRGIALTKLGFMEDALTSADAAIRLNPGLAEAYNNRGNTLMGLHRADEALADFDRAIALRPNFGDAFVNRGNALKTLKRPDEAVASYDQALAFVPALVAAWSNKGSVLKDMKRLDEALASHQQALRLNPGSALAMSEVRTLKAHMCLWDEDNRPALLGTGDDAVPPFYMLRLDDDPAHQLQAARAWSAARYGPDRHPAFPPRERKGRIRIGYFSADFREHAVMYLIARLFELHDRERFEIHAFSYGAAARDDMRQRLVSAVDEFHQVDHLGDEAISKLARSLDIDIAVDLMGHTENTRMGIFAHRAAPAQVNYLGYPGTSGAEFIDHIIADPIVIPQAQCAHYSENVLYLPHCYQPNDNQRAIADRMFTRAEAGLPEDAFVFACFNASYKITMQEFDIWMRLLGQVPGSVLWLYRSNRWAEDNLRNEAEKRGIDARRLVFADGLPVEQHLARQHLADLFLDTFAVNAHTTASDALWGGLPVLTCMGQSFAARVAGSLLYAVGLPELVTQTREDYEALALDLATNPQRLANLRARLAANRLTAPLFDTEGHVRAIEQLYEQIALLP